MPIVNLPGFFGNFAPNNYPEAGQRLNVNVRIFEGTSPAVELAANNFLVALPTTLGATPMVLGITSCMIANNVMTLTVIYGWYS